MAKPFERSLYGGRGSFCSTFMPLECDTDVSLLDSMPIVTCSGKRNAKVAIEIIDIGYCSTKSMYYYGSNYMRWPFTAKKVAFPRAGRNQPGI